MFAALMATNNDYVFVTRWRVEATIEEVSEILDDALVTEWRETDLFAIARYDRVHGGAHRFLDQ